MIKRLMMIGVFMVFGLSLAGCAGSPAATVSGRTSGSPVANSTEMTAEAKLVVGTLKLEGTDLAVSAEQAQALLPLWKAVKALSSDANTSELEMAALYEQIKEAMSAEQMKEIDSMSFDGEAMSGLMQQYGASLLSDEQRATREAASSNSSSSQGGNRGAGGPPGGMPGGMPPGGMPMDGGMRPDNASAGAQNAANRGGQMNLMFIEPLIKLLTERAG